MLQHNANDGFSSYTKSKGPWKLVHKEEYDNEKEARKREKFFKTGKGREFLKDAIGQLSAEADQVLHRPPFNYSFLDFRTTSTTLAISLTASKFPRSAR